MLSFCVFLNPSVQSYLQPDLQDVNQLIISVRAEICFFVVPKVRLFKSLDFLQFYVYVSVVY